CFLMTRTSDLKPDYQPLYRRLISSQGRIRGWAGTRFAHPPAWAARPCSRINFERSHTMIRHRVIVYVMTGGLLLSSTPGCENLPGNPKEQGTVAGGVGGAVAGAAIAGKNNRLLGALIGGALGAGGGYLIGANWDKINGKDKEGATRADENARTHPAAAKDVDRSKTA